MVIRGKKVCKTCKLQHSSVNEQHDTCVSCEVWEYVQVQKREFAFILTYLNDRCVCFYCGEGATDKEHVIPKSLAYPTWIVPACRECNGLAGVEPFVNVMDKLDYIKHRREKKHASLLRMPEWTKQEIEELGHSLRVTIQAQQRAKETIQAQLVWNPLVNAMPP